MNHLTIFLALAVVHLTAATLVHAQPQYFEIQVLDAETKRGVPLVELTTPNQVRYVTDSAGRIAYFEPGLMGETLFFSIQAHGYEVPVDGLGVAGVRFDVKPGSMGKVELKRTNLAERLYRITGQGIYRDSVLLGYETPLRDPLHAGKVAGQDSAFAVPYRDKLYWFWGDTSRMSYGLGMFRTAGATSEWPGQDGLPVDKGIDFTYFTDKEGFCRAMVDVANPEGVVWLFGITTVPDVDGRVRMMAHYARRKGLEKLLEHGVAVYNDKREIFEVKTTLPLDETWRYPTGQPVRVTVNGEEHLYFGVPFPNIRVKATLDAVLDPKQYEAFSCTVSDEGESIWTWTKDREPTSPKDELKLNPKPEEMRFLPEDAGKPGRRIILHTGSVRWNAHRQKWVLIAVEDAFHVKDSPSALGEVWYSEADAPEGPYRKAVNILTHHKLTFYNPVHHEFFDEDGGRVIYFEGTYTNQFTESPPTPYYEYNQMMYRLDLGIGEISEVFGAGR